MMRRVCSKQHESGKKTRPADRFDSIFFLTVIPICFLSAVYFALSALEGAV